MKKISWERVVRIILLVIFIIAIFNPVSVYTISQLIGDRMIKPTLYLNDKHNPVLEELTVDSYCDPLSCSNTYLILTKNRVLKADFEYCNYAGISGNVFLGGKNRRPISYFGSSENCGFNSSIAYFCKEGDLLTEYRLYELFPYPKKITINYYSCSSK